MTNKLQLPKYKISNQFWSSNIGVWDLPFDLAQGGESFDFAQDREPAERLVEPFVIWWLRFVIYHSVSTPNV